MAFLLFTSPYRWRVIQLASGHVRVSIRGSSAGMFSMAIGTALILCVAYYTRGGGSSIPLHWPVIAVMGVPGAALFLVGAWLSLRSNWFEFGPKGQGLIKRSWLWHGVQPAQRATVDHLELVVRPCVIRTSGNYTITWLRGFASLLIIPDALDRGPYMIPLLISKTREEADEYAKHLASLTGVELGSVKSEIEGSLMKGLL